MRKHLLLFFVMFASVLSLSAQDDTSVENAVITIKTNKAVDTELTIEGYAIDSKDALTVDWGDGVEKTYVPSNSWNTYVSATGKLKGETVKISGNLRTLEIKGAGVTSFECASAPNLEELNLSDNALTAFTVSNMPKLKILKLQKNAISFYGDLDIQKAAPTLEELDISDNQLNMYDLSKFKKLEYFYANNNPQPHNRDLPRRQREPEGHKDEQLRHCSFLCHLPTLSARSGAWRQLYQAGCQQHGLRGRHLPQAHQP